MTKQKKNLALRLKVYDKDDLTGLLTVQMVSAKNNGRFRLQINKARILALRKGDIGPGVGILEYLDSDNNRTKSYVAVEEVYLPWPYGEVV